CPTGIDIRDGLQLDSISCGACIDACDTVMDKMGYARGLVRYTSERALAGGKTQWLRPNLVGYAAMLLLMIGAFVWALQTRPLVSLDVSKDRGLFRENGQGQIENIYSLKVINKTQEPRRYVLALVDAERFTLQGKRELRLAPGEILDLPVSVALTAERAARSPQTLRFEVVDLSDPAIRVSAKSTFVAPVNR
ncbi:MAG: FixG Ig-like domain-containing protein, partial [Pseudomonas sp.]